MAKIRNISEVHSVSDALKDIIYNVQEILRCEVRLAKIEIREETNNAKKTNLLIAYAAFGSTFAALLLLLGITHLANLLANGVSAIFSVANNLTVKNSTRQYE